MLPNRKRRPYFMYVVLAFSSAALRNKKMLAYLLCWTLLRLVGKMDVKLIGIRNHTSICPNCLGPSVNVTSTDPEVTLGSCVSSL